MYDELGRLKRVIDEHGNVATYNYDAVGNILSIERGDGGCPVGPPTISQVKAGPCFAGTSCRVTIEGNSLLGAGVTAGNALATVTDCRGDCTRITCVLNASPFIAPGPVNVTVTTALGSAQGTVDILRPPTVGGLGAADVWHFAANTGDVITLIMTRIPNQGDGSSTLDPALELRDSRGFNLAFDDDSGSNIPPGPGRNAVIQNFVLPATDSYTVLARGGNGTSGPYVLEIAPSTIALTRESSTPPAPAFVFQGTVSAIPSPAPAAFTFNGTIASGTEKDTFTFPANAGTVASILVNRVASNPDGSGSLNPAVELRDSRGFLLARDDDTGTSIPSGPGHNALILNFTLPATDTYSLIAAGAGGTTGPYEVKVVFGQLFVETQAATFTFPANKGKVASIRVSRVANNPDGTGSLDPRVELRDSRGVLIANDDDAGTDQPPGPGRNALIPRFTLPATDTYSITVRGSNGTVGPFTVEVFLE